MTFSRDPVLHDRLTCTVPEMAAALGIGRDAAYAAVDRGELPAIRVGRRLIVPVARLHELLGLEPPGMEAAALAGTAAQSEPADQDDHRPASSLARQTIGPHAPEGRTA